jgi:biotin operon repressor
MLKIQPNSRQIPSNKSYTAEKKYSDLLYGVLQEMSELSVEDGKNIRYVLQRDVSFVRLGDRIGLTRQTVSTKFKHLISTGLIIEDNEKKRYILTNLDRTVSSLIPFDTLRKLNNTLSHNSISTFVYLLNRYIAEGERPYYVTLRQIKEFLGLAVTTSSNDLIITDILQVLSLLGLIVYTKEFVEETKSMFKVQKVSNMVASC